MKYRAEIDGLRALAVLSVVIYHANIGYLSGGFLGVDVFFVISGFLITKNIISEQEKGTFHIFSFYDRRARRLLPVLYLVFAIASFFAWEYLLPADLVDFSASLLSALVFASNFFFYAQDNYHAAESATKPLLHTWSLGVEEQFYLFFPLLLILLSSFSRSRKILFLSIILFLSLCFAQYVSEHYADMNFFLLPSRLWEFLVGAVLALVCADGLRHQRSFLGSVLSISGVVMIVVSIVLFGSEIPHPSFLTIIPVVGAAAVIGWGHACAVTMGVMGNKFSTWLGRLSYSIYLWHFPIFAFAYTKSNGVLSNFEKIELLLITLVLSSISYYLVEKPFRDREKIGNRVFYALLVIISLVLSVWSFHVIKGKGFDNRLGDIESLFEGADRNDSFLKKDGKICYFHPEKPKSCKFDDFDGSKTIVSLGDSHANMISVPLQRYAQNHGYNFYNMILSHCPYIEGAWRYTGFKAKCEVSQMDAVRDYLKSIEPSIIIYTARWPLYLNRTQFDNGEGGIEKSAFLPFYPSKEARLKGARVDDLIVKTFELMVQMGHSVVLVYPTPEVGWHVPALIKERLDQVSETPVDHKRKAFEKMNITTSYSRYKNRTKLTNSILDRVQHEKIKKVYPDKLFCSDVSGRCKTHDDKSIFYYDDDHLSQVGASMLVEEIAHAVLELENIRK